MVLSQETFLLLRNFVYEKTGMYYKDTKKYLFENRLYRRIIKGNFKSYEEYYYFLRFDPNNREELKALYEVITTNETYFFRNLHQLESFESKVLPVVIKNKLLAKQPELKIWSAGCSTGEEPYTISMMTIENSNLLQNINIEILATDISQGVLCSANRGVYYRNSIREMPEHYLKKFFQRVKEDEYILSDGVKKRVKFRHLNLIDKEKMRAVANIDVIFCRNVLIYFDDRSKKEVIASFYDSLRPTGFLFIGHSESLHTISRAFKVLHYGPTIVYQKE
ncbi:MAG: protein-glutamate O-methyltransferase CheR [bacterium]